MSLIKQINAVNIRANEVSRLCVVISGLSAAGMSTAMQILNDEFFKIWIDKFGYWVNGQFLNRYDKLLRYVEAHLSDPYIAFQTHVQMPDFITDLLRSQFDHFNLMYIISDYSTYVKLSEKRAPYMEKVSQRKFQWMRRTEYDNLIRFMRLHAATDKSVKVIENNFDVAGLKAEFGWERDGVKYSHIG